MSDLTGSLRRRWVLGLVCLALIIGVTIAAVQRVGPSYRSHATALLVPPHISQNQPTTGPDYTRGNPLFFLGALDQTRDVLIGSLTSRQTQEFLGHRFPGSTYTVTPDLLDSAAILDMTVESASSAETVAMMDELANLVPRSLALVQQQLGVNVRARITSQTLVKDQAPAISHKAQIRRGIEVVAGLGLMCLFLIAGVDSVLLTSGRRRLARARGDDPTPHGSGASPASQEGVVGDSADDDAAGRRHDAEVSPADETELEEAPPNNVRPLVKVTRSKKSRRRTGVNRQTSSNRGRARGR